MSEEKESNRISVPKAIFYPVLVMVGVGLFNSYIRQGNLEERFATNSERITVLERQYTGVQAQINSMEIKMITNFSEIKLLIEERIHEKPQRR